MIERERLSEIYERFSGELFRYIYGFVKSRDTAEDLLHDVFVRFIGYSRERDVREEGIKALLYTISKNICIDHLRKTGRVRLEEFDEATLPQGPADEAADDGYAARAERLHELVEAMDADSRSLYTMRVEMAMTYREIAERLSMSERTVKRRMAALVKSLMLALRSGGE
ncbi:MAG: sigma-70 family RNA polymerase sigma factor [Spirochaetes bacterium]|nr:sigma-70 family RNA polymerase sigma factor [Spirochaetota bacterium]